ncbi:NADP-dependent malic enzyme [Terrihabitans rhizophilus]|uniref:NADP-dependent malic enzyme n=1 Tax=Terrihabitans rhizophilus TaxID=3092662 RepID=A0ABU4RKB6_9HYPH|nr:NADP-dependent malic enzyme [Terrihabitans sp. PJ23]MDX6805281.1 NADP-dependent malic enzyme [Terrihabitans sp. PJ23]
MASNISDELRKAAVAFHRYPTPGKLEIQATKPLSTQRDLALAYSPGVAAACEAIAENEELAAELTIRQNLVGVISNGTAVLGLGNIGPLASKPVMEGKAVLFKKFAGIDVFDIEIAATEPDRVVEVVAALEPTFGGINLEDIKAPECFEIEEKLKARMKIPVFHDDQHGTAIIVAAAIVNALELAEKRIEDVKIVTSGAGAAATACLNLLVSMGARKENIWATDIEGVIYEGRNTLMNPWTGIYAQPTDKRTLGEVIEGADIFLGVSAGNVLKPEMAKLMAEKPLILALANPVPEIMPDLAREVRPDAMICTGRSDFPNQVNNVLCFPFIFRGALDVGASTINEEMKQAAVKAIAALAREASSDVVARAYGGDTIPFGPESLIPNPFDPRLILRIAPAVARAAMESGVARRPIADFDAYDDRLSRFVYRSGFVMKPIFAAAKEQPKCVIYAEGEDERTLRAAQVVIEEGIARPVLIGRPSVIETRLKRFGLSIKAGQDFKIVNPEDDPRYRDYVSLYLERAGRHGVTPDLARTIVRTDATVIAALSVLRGEADAMICGLEGRYPNHLSTIDDVLGKREGVSDYAAVSLLITTRGALFITDTYVSLEPTAMQIAEKARLGAEVVRRFGLEPKVALLSHANFGSRASGTAGKMRDALAILTAQEPGLEVDGEMNADLALSQELRDRVLPSSRLKGEANLLVMPDLDAAKIASQLVAAMDGSLPIGPILVGAAHPAQIVTSTTTVRGLVNVTSLAVMEAQTRSEG